MLVSMWIHLCELWTFIIYLPAWAWGLGVMIGISVLLDRVELQMKAPPQ